MVNLWLIYVIFLEQYWNSESLLQNTEQLSAVGAEIFSNGFVIVRNFAYDEKFYNGIEECVSITYEA